MLSVLVLAFLTCVDGSSRPVLSRRIRYQGRDDRLYVYNFHASNAQFYLLSVYHAAAGYINSTLTTKTNLQIHTGKCGRNYNLTIIAFNGYGSSQPVSVTASSEQVTPSISEPRKSDLRATITWTNRCEARHDLHIVDQNSAERTVPSVRSPYTFSMQRDMLYAVKVNAVYENGKRSSSLKYITSAGWPGDVKSISSSGMYHSFHFTWTVAEYADLYQINISSSSDALFRTSINSRINKLDVYGVKAGRRYKFSIKAINSQMEGSIRTEYFYTISDVPLIQQVSISGDGTAKIVWTKAQNNEMYYLVIRDITGTSRFSGQVADSVYTWKAYSASVNAYAYVRTLNYDSNRKSIYFYFGNAASRPVITSVVRTSGSQLRVAATTIDSAATYRIKIRVQTFFVSSDGHPTASSYRDSTFQEISPWLASAYHYSGGKSVYYVTILTYSDRDGSYEACSDTFVYKQEPPPGVSSISQSYVSSNAAGITWSAPDGYVERYWVIATPDTGVEVVANTSTTGRSRSISGLKRGRYYTATVTAENSAGRGPPQKITLKTTMGNAYVSRVVQVAPYMARIYVRPAPEAMGHVLFIDNNRTQERRTVTSGDNSVIHKLAGSLKLRVRVVAVYETGNTSSTYDFQGKCEADSCAGNASCTLDESYNPICFCKTNFEGDGRTGCFPFCLDQQVGNYNFSRVPVGQVAYSEEKCLSGHSNASVLCEIRRYGTKFRTFISSLKAIKCDFELGNITSEENAITAYGAERHCRIFEVATSKLSLINRKDTTKITIYLEKLANSDTKMSSRGLKSCLLTASHLTSYFRVHHDSEYAERLLKTLPRLFRFFDTPYRHYHHPRDFKWTSDNIFAQVTDVPTRFASVRKAENFSIFAEFLSLNGTGRPEYPMEIIIPFASVASVHEQMSRETECSLSAIRIVFLSHRDSSLFPKSSSADWITFLEMGTRKRAGKMNATQQLLIRKALPKRDNTSQFQSEPLSEFFCVALDTKNFRWKKDGCSRMYGGTEECASQQFGYYGI